MLVNHPVGPVILIVLVLCVLKFGLPLFFIIVLDFVILLLALPNPLVHFYYSLQFDRITELHSELVIRDSLRSLARADQMSQLALERRRVVMSVECFTD